MNNFVYNIPTKVYFGENQLSHLGEELRKYGTRVLLTYGGGSIKKIGLYDKVMTEIKNAGLEVFELSGIEPNPRIGSNNPRFEQIRMAQAIQELGFRESTLELIMGKNAVEFLGGLD